jgi:hypothetical protein
LLVIDTAASKGRDTLKAGVFTGVYILLAFNPEVFKRS